MFDADELPEALDALHGFDVQHLMVEGGARVAQEFLRRGLVDRLVIFQSPITLGADALSPFEGLAEALLTDVRNARVVRRSELGEDVMTVYALSGG